MQSQKTNFELTWHVIKRAQQRGITREDMELTLQFGKQSWGNDGRIISCTKSSLARMKKQGIPAHAIERASKTVLVLKDNSVVTVIPKGSGIRHKI